MKITLVIEDTPKGVSVTATPKFSEIMQMAKNEATTAAHAYAVAAMNRLNELGKATKKSKSSIIIPVPKIYGRG